jgi:soluble lytic murein transglycosylase
MPKNHSPWILSFLLLLIVGGCNFLGLPPVEQGATPGIESEKALASATPTATLPPTPTPTPLPAARISAADQALLFGETERARQEYLSAALDSQDVEIQASAVLGIGRSYFAERNYPQAVETFRSLINEHPANQSLPNAYYFLARSYLAQDMPAEAAQAFAKYLELKPGVLDDLIQMERADALMAAGEYAGAIEAYQAAIQASSGDKGQALIKIGQAYAALGDFTNAVKTYLEAYASSDNPYIKAQANLLSGQIYTQLGFPEQAYARYQDSVANFHEAYDSYSALLVLVQEGIPVSDLDRGIVDYYAGQYGYAAEALARYLASHPDHDGSPHHFRALSLRRITEYYQAIDEWRALIRDHPEDAYWDDAWQEIAYTQWAYLEDFDAAAETLKNFVALRPDAPDAPQALFTAGRILERGDRLTQAATTWARLIEEYPSAEISSRGLFLSGITYIRLRNYPQALTSFQRMAALAANPSDQSAALLWSGKTQLAMGDWEAARAAWEQAATLDPTGYYSERALELLENRPPFTVTENIDLGIDLETERLQAEDWLRATFNISPEVDLSTSVDLESLPLFRRGLALWEIGEYQQARGQFESLREQLESDPVNSWRFMNRMLDLGVYRSAVFASRQILNLAGMNDLDTLAAPRYFNHVRFGLYYKDLVLQEAAEEGFHPLFIFSLIRQESFFEGYVQSSAGALGLMQIMPATGDELASRYNWPPNYTTSVLLNPSVNLRLGVKYLANQLGYFGGDIYVALAAYNGGPGNAKFWSDLASGDQDLFLEVIRFEETQRYIKNIAEFMHLYRKFYTR